MKDTSRPQTTPSQPAPCRKRKASGPASPARAARRAHDPSQDEEEMTPPDGAHGSRRHEARSRAASKSIHNVPHARRHASTDGWPTRVIVSGPGPHADVSGPSLRRGQPTARAFAGQRKAESPQPDSATAFLHSIELPDKPPGGPPLPFDPPSLRLPPLSTDSLGKDTCTNGNGYQVSLAYKGHPFTYDLSALPDDPRGTIALLTLTKSDPGAYLLVGAHYRRTGRSRAACAVIRSLLDSLDGSGSNVEKESEATPVTARSDTSTATLPSSGTPACPKPTTTTAYMGAAVRPALLLLAACELDMSRERPGDPESGEHASAAHELFRAVYGIAGDGVVAGVTHSRPHNALGLELSMPSSGVVPLTRANLKDLEGELGAARAAQRTLQDRLAVSDDRLARAEDKARALESDTREILIQLGASRDESRRLRQRLAESEQRARELVQCTPSTESRVWGKLKDLLFDNLGGVRGE